MSQICTRYGLKNLVVILSLILPLTSYAIEKDYTHPEDQEEIVWKNLTNAVTTAHTIQKSGGCDGCPDAGGMSEQSISARGGSIEFSVTGTDHLLYGGLVNGSLDSHPSYINFSFRIQAGILEIRESGVYKYDTPVLSGDKLKISIEDGIAHYYKNASLIYSSLSPPSYPLHFTAALLGSGAVISGATIEGATSEREDTGVSLIRLD